MQRSECDFMEMLYCGGKAWLSCCMLIYFFPLTEILVACHRETERSGGWLRAAVHMEV